MSSKPARPASLASQFILYFACASAFLLLCGLGIFYWLVVLHAEAEDKVALKDEVLALSAIPPGDSPAALQEELTVLGKGRPPVYWVRVLDPAGRTVAQTSGMDALLPAALFPNATITARGEFPTREKRIGRRLFSLTATSLAIGPQRYLMQVAQDRSVDDEFTGEFLGVLAAVVLFGTLASVLIAIPLTRRGLQPLATLTRSLRSVEPTHRNVRVEPAVWPLELQPLAVAFDEMLDRLEESFTRLSQFSADLAHELRTPIANIQGEAEVALSRPRSAEEYRAIIESSVTECKNLSAIVDNLLFLARADAAESRLDRSSFDGRQAIEKIAHFHELIAEEQQVTIICEGEGQVFADPILFTRAVNNLVENALRFTAAGGAIRIRLRDQAAATEVSVSDTGSGIEAHHLPKIFDRFYRVDPSRSSQGVGLGLALVKSITDLHGGSARIQSEPGRGTTVILTFARQ